MPSKGYKQTEEHRAKLAAARARTRAEGKGPWAQERKPRPEPGRIGRPKTIDRKCADCDAERSYGAARCKPCANKESAERRAAATRAGGKKPGWPAGVPRTEEAKAAIRAGMAVSPTQEARRRWSFCVRCGTRFRARNPGQENCSRACSMKGWGVTSAGYVWVRLRDGSDELLHRAVVEQTIGRPLEDHETVHHRNGLKLDNRPENLELWTGRHGRGARVDEAAHCPTCTCTSSPDLNS